MMITKMDIMNLVSLILNVLAMIIIGVCYFKIKVIKKHDDEKKKDNELKINNK